MGANQLFSAFESLHPYEDDLKFPYNLEYLTVIMCYIYIFSNAWKPSFCSLACVAATSGANGVAPSRAHGARRAPGATRGRH